MSIQLETSLIAPGRPRSDEAVGHTSDTPVSTQETARPGWSGHIPALDGVRGMAIALVMIAHAVMDLFPRGGFDRAAVEIARAGWVGVDLFFVLSGFLITGILLDARMQPHYFRNFYVRRTLRIFPLYYGILLAFFVVLPLVASFVRAHEWFATLYDSRWWFWTYTPNVLVAISGSWDATGKFGHFWSLAVEEQFYLIWPAVVLVCSPRILRRLCVVLMITAFAFRLGIRNGSVENLAAYTLMPARVDTLAAGAWIAVALRTGVPLDQIKRLARWVLACCATTLVALIIRAGRFHEMDFAVQTVGYSILALGFAALLSLALDTPARETALGRIFRHRALRTLGKYSYAMYCFHPFIQYALRPLGFDPQIFPRVFGSVVPGAIAYGVVILVLTLVVSVASWQLFERHFLRLKDYFPTRAEVARA